MSSTMPAAGLRPAPDVANPADIVVRNAKIYTGHATRQSLEIYSRLALAGAQQRYDDVIGDFPV
jgi:hypothetical protein